MSKSDDSSCFDGLPVKLDSILTPESIRTICESYDAFKKQTAAPSPAATSKSLTSPPPPGVTANKDAAPAHQVARARPYAVELTRTVSYSAKDSEGNEIGPNRVTCANGAFAVELGTSVYYGSNSAPDKLSAGDKPTFDALVTAHFSALNPLNKSIPEQVGMATDLFLTGSTKVTADRTDSPLPPFCAALKAEVDKGRSR